MRDRQRRTARRIAQRQYAKERRAVSSSGATDGAGIPQHRMCEDTTKLSASITCRLQELLTIR